MTETFAEFTAKLGYAFRDPALIETALTHRSCGRLNNERFEYLGDAILDFIIAEELFRRFPDAAEGSLTRLRASLVKRETLALLARQLGVGDQVRLGTGEQKSGGWRRESILANTLESVIGAIYLDSGLDACRAVVLRMFQDQVRNLTVKDPGKDPKTALQELLQSQRLPLPVYQIVSEAGEAHARTFRVECRVDDLQCAVVAEGRSKRNAEQAAAKLALELLQARSP